MRWMAAFCTAALVLGAGCKKNDKKDSPAAPATTKTPAPTAGAAKTPAEPAKAGTPAASPAADPKVKGEPTAKPASDPKATGDTPGKAPAADPAKAPAAVEGRSVLGVTFPAKAMGAVTLSSLDAVLKAVTEKAAAFGKPLPIDKAAILDRVKGFLNLSSMDWMATDRPIHIAVWDPSNPKEMGILMVPITSAEALEKALPADKKKDDQGNAFSFPVMLQRIYVNTTDGYATVTGNPKGFTEARAFLSGVAKGAATPSGLVDVRVAVGNLRETFASRLQRVRAKLDRIQKRLATEISGTSMLPGMEKTLQFYFDMINTLVEETEGSGLSLALTDGGGLQITGRIQGKEGGKIAGFAKKLGESDLSFAKGIPESAYMVFASDMDMQGFDGLMKYSSEMLAGILKLSDADKGKLQGYFKTMVETVEGKSWAAVYSAGNFPFAVGSVTRVKDGAAYRKVFNGYLSLLIARAVDMVKELQLSDEIGAVDSNNIDALVKLANKAAAMFGVTLALDSKTEGDVTVDSFSIAVDVAKIAEAGDPKVTAGVQKVTALIGTKLEFAVAYGKENVAMAMGPAAIAESKRLLTASGGRAVPARAQKAAFYFEVDANKALAAAAPIVGALPGVTLPTLPAGTRLEGSAGADASGLIELGMVLPMDQIAKIALMLGEMGFGRKREDRKPAAAVPVAPPPTAPPSRGVAPDGGAAPKLAPTPTP